MNKCRLSNNTRDYAKRYECILDKMIDQMTCVKMTNSISAGFITQMITHHRAAIEMSKNLLCYTTNIPLQDIALNIISSQEKSIQNMTRALPECKACINNPREIRCYTNENHRIISDFMREMIPHHRGAVRMSENALRFCLCPELVPLLNEIIVSQKKGIKEMECLLKKLDC